MDKRTSFDLAFNESPLPEEGGLLALLHPDESLPAPEEEESLKDFLKPFQEDAPEWEQLELRAGDD
ncbi:MAG: hypothetical protein AB1899_16300 [Pseudomonadota bacterium]